MSAEHRQGQKTLLRVARAQVGELFFLVHVVQRSEIIIRLTLHGINASSSRRISRVDERKPVGKFTQQRETSSSVRSFLRRTYHVGVEIAVLVRSHGFFDLTHAQVHVLASARVVQKHISVVIVQLGEHFIVLFPERFVIVAIVFPPRGHFRTYMAYIYNQKSLPKCVPVKTSLCA